MFNLKFNIMKMLIFFRGFKKLILVYLKGFYLIRVLLNNTAYIKYIIIIYIKENLFYPFE